MVFQWGNRVNEYVNDCQHLYSAVLNGAVDKLQPLVPEYKISVDFNGHNPHSRSILHFLVMFRELVFQRPPLIHSIRVYAYEDVILINKESFDINDCLVFDQVCANLMEFVTRVRLVETSVYE